MSRKGNLVTIVPIAKALETDPVLFDSEKQDIQYGNVIVTRVYDLRFINTSSAENLLKEMKLGAHIKGVDEAGKLIVTDYAYRMNRVDELLRIIDRPGELKQFRYRQLRYTMAASLAEQVETLAEQLGTVSITVSAEEPQEIKRRRGESTAAFRRRQQQARSSAAKTSGQPTGQPMVYLDADERTNRILMIGMPEQLDIVETLIDSLDVAQQDLRTLRLYDIQYAGAEEVMQKLQDLGIITASKRTTQQSGRITAPQRGQKPAAAQETSAPTVLTEEGLVEEPQIVIIESTNSLLVNATAEQHAQIATIIAYVDAEPEQAALNYVVYPLENQDPEELATVLNQLVKETIEETTSGPDSKVVKTTSQRRIEDDITIIAEPSTYSLVVYANKKHQQWINAIIEQLDQYRPQVLLDVTLVSITKNDDFNYSLNLLTKYPTLSGVAQITGETSSIFDKRFWEAQSDSGSGSFFYNDDHVQALLTAVQTRNWGRVLSSPKLLVNDNQEGIIKQERTIYITETNVTTTTTTTTPTTNTDVKFAPYTTGIDLTIKPHISKGNQLRLEIKLVRDDFEGAPQTVTVGGSSYEKPPNERSNDINSVVTVPDGYTVILGGIEQLSQSKGGSKVPLLGDIPIIGGIFNSINNSDEQSRLYIFVKAHILRPSYTVGDDTDIVKVSQKMRAKFEKLEEDFQKSQDWPGIDPEPLDPLKSLEAD
jgi:type II secretory pathway component GspD/PulD (secretin)